MKHLKTEIEFKHKNEDLYKVIYKDVPIAEIFINNNSVHKFDSLPRTKAKHPNKTNAQELIKFYKKLCK